MQFHNQHISAPLNKKSSAALNDLVSKPLLNKGMTNDEVRRYRLDLLISEFGGVGRLAAVLEKSSSQVSQWRNASPDSKTGKPRTMNDDTARYIEKRAGKDRGWLDIPPADLPASAPSSREPSESNTEPGPDLSGHVPLISWVQAGDWSHAADLLQPGEAFEWIRTTVTVQTHTFALRVTGDSMEPDFPAGMILVVEPEMDPHPGDFVIVKNGDDEATFKQLVKDGADLYLKPLNPRYPIKPLGASRIVGVVREAVRKLR